MRAKTLIFLFGILSLLLIYGCGQIQELEEVQNSKAMDWPTLFVEGDYPGDVSNGTQQFPYKNIQEAINSAKSGQTIYVKSLADPLAAYNERLYINKYINLQGDGATKIDVELSPTADYITQGIIVFAGASACGSVSGFEITHTTWNVGSGILCTNNAKPVIENNKFISHLIGVYAYYDAQPIIRNNTFEANGLAIWIAGDMSAPAKIYCNKIIDCWAPRPGTWAGVMLSDGAKADIYNNIFTKNLVGVWLMGTTKGASATIANNLFYNNRVNNEFSKACYIATNSTANIFNNIFDDNHIGVKGNPAVKLYYNSFSRNDEDYNISIVDVTEDITSLVPAYEDFDSFKLSNPNDFKDIGHPGSVYNDKDGSRNDLGKEGGPYAL